MGDAGNVYVVEDDEAVRASLVALLELGGWHISEYASGDLFLADIAALPPGCVLLDMRMPGLDGIEVLERLPGGLMVLPVVVMTGHPDPTLAAAALHRGAIEFLEKPFSDDDLFEAVARALEALPA
ncbi:MAG TPA: response regulator [Allosphingosinicella sp.]